MNRAPTTRALRALGFGLALVASAGCARGGAAPDRAPAVAPPLAAAQAPAAATTAPVTFVNRVWVVGAGSSTWPGAYYVFLADGTLVITSPHGNPAIGAWTRDARGLTMIEEGKPYAVDVLKLDADAFWVRMNNPGPPVILHFAPADTLPPSSGATR